MPSLADGDFLRVLLRRRVAGNDRVVQARPCPSKWRRCASRWPFPAAARAASGLRFLGLDGGHRSGGAAADTSTSTVSMIVRMCLRCAGSCVLAACSSAVFGAARRCAGGTGRHRRGSTGIRSRAACRRHRCVSGARCAAAALPLLTSQRLGDIASASDRVDREIGVAERDGAVVFQNQEDVARGEIRALRRACRCASGRKVTSSDTGSRLSNRTRWISATREPSGSVESRGDFRSHLTTRTSADSSSTISCRIADIASENPCSEVTF